MRITEETTIELDGKKIAIKHEGEKYLDAGVWAELVRLIKQDLDNGEGFYPYANFEASVEWHVEP